MEWLLDPGLWIGLLTLIVLEIVLGIDNLIFIAILADKLPPKERDRARLMGLGMALIMRLALLSAMTWMFRLTAPLFTVWGQVFSGRDLIMIAGGFFLVFKGTMEMHERVEGKTHSAQGPRVYATFGIIVTQIVVFDAVFSLDAVITAVGMVNHLPVMMTAVVIAMAAMLLASKPLSHFVSAHPTVIVLCLGFLLMIGFALVAEGFGFVVPKGYLYAAIGFSVMIETLNQLARVNLAKAAAHIPMRERTAEGILRMLGKRPTSISPTEDDLAPTDTPFGVEERNMVSGVLRLAERSVHSIMTPRTDISWINLDDDVEAIRQVLTNTPHGFYPVCRGSLDDILGIGRAKDMIADLLQRGRINEKALRPAIIVHETIAILDLMETLKGARGQLVIIINEFGAVEGLVTPIDVFEAIAGDFPDEDETPDIVAEGDNTWLVDGGADLHHVEQTLDVSDLANEDEEFSTLAGYLLQQFGRLPEEGDATELEQHGWRLRFEVLNLEGRRISQVRVTRASVQEHDAA